MKQKVTADQIMEWIKRHSAEMCKDDPRMVGMAENCAFQLGAMASTLSSVLNDPKYGRELIKRVTQ